MARPTFATPAAPPPSRPRSWEWAWWLAAVLLAGGLVLQLMLADRARLATDARWRPRLEALCDLLGCSLPPWREPKAFRVTAREVRPHPVAPGVLLVSLSFRNDARWPQPWPVMELELTDMEDQALGLRRFSPGEYLGAPPETALIAPGQSASTTLEIIDPGKRVAAFNFDFH